MVKSKSSLADLSQWVAKINFLKDQIDSIEKIKGIHILTISVFLLKCQLVEFDLKYLITKLDLHIYFSNISKIVKTSTRTPISFDDKLCTLGSLIYILDRFKSPEISDLVKNLKSLNKLRTKFTHKLFSSEMKINDIGREAAKGVNESNLILNQIKSLNKLLNDNDPLEI